MKRFLCASAVAVALTTTAGAADLPMKYPVKAVPMPVFSWTGFYVGGNVGYGWGGGSDDYYRNNKCLKKPPVNVLAAEEVSAFDGDGGGGTPCVTQTTLYHLSGGGGNGGGGDPSGIVAGGQIGYNYQFANNVVLGIEADLQGTDIKSSTEWAPFRPPGAFGRETAVDYYGTIRLRLGYAFDRFLPYVTGGLAYGKMRWSEHAVAAFDPNNNTAMFNYAANDSATKWGWTVGAGGEYALTDNWSIRAEYLYVALSDMDYAFQVPNVETWGFVNDNRFGSIDGSFHTVRVGVNYRF